MKAYPTYKDSGIDWLGEVPQHWEKYRTPSILKVISKAGTDSDELLSVYLDRGVIRHSESDGMQVHKPSKDMSAYQKVLPGNFVCNNQQAWRGSVGVSEYEGRISPAYIIFKLSSKLVPQFANYFFRSQAWNPSFVYSSKGVGSIQRNLYLPWLRQHYCYLPTTEEQQFIVAYLDKKCAEIDELVSRRQAIIERLKELKQSIIAEAVTKGLNSDVPMKDSGLAWMPEVPEHWKIERLQWHLREIKETNSPVKTDRVLSLTNKKGVIPYEEKGNQGNRAKESHEEYKLAYPETLVMNSMNVIIGSVGICNYFGCVSPVYYVYRTMGETSLEYINYIFQTVRFQKELRRHAKGILEIRLRLSSSDILKSKVALPPVSEQLSIVDYLDKKCAEIDELISRHEQTIEKLKELKTATIAHVVTGKMDVRDAI